MNEEYEVGEIRFYISPMSGLHAYHVKNPEYIVSIDDTDIWPEDTYRPSPAYIEAAREYFSDIAQDSDACAALFNL